jgi:hypothetical protein
LRLRTNSVGRGGLTIAAGQARLEAALERHSGIVTEPSIVFELAYLGSIIVSHDEVKQCHGAVFPRNLVRADSIVQGRGGVILAPRFQQTLAGLILPFDRKAARVSFAILEMIKLHITDLAAGPTWLSD